MDKRACDRILTQNAVRIQRKGSQSFANTIARDLSRTGIGFISDAFFPLATQLIFETFHPATNQLVKRLGEVVWVTGQPYSDRFSIGARFLEPAAII